MEVSVVIPLFNKEQYISRTIDSVLNQTVQPSEIIVINDGSTDHSESVVKMYTDPRIRLITQENAGEGAARNKGVEESKNSLVAFLDADDEWKTGFLLHIQRIYNNFPDCGAYATAYDVIEPDGSKSYPLLIGIPPAPWIGILPNFFKMMQYGNTLCSSSVVMPKKVFYDLKGFPEGIVQGADRMMWVRLGMEYPIAYSPSRQVVIHGEAQNRASSAFVKEPMTANLIDKMLVNKEVPEAIIEDIKDYNAYLKIQKVQHRVKANQAKSARELLSSIKQNRKYRNQILWWYFWSFMPYWFIKKISRQ